jgi:hypothetical protein
VPIYTATVTVDGYSKELGKFKDINDAEKAVKDYRNFTGVFHENHGKAGETATGTV